MSDGAQPPRREYECADIVRDIAAELGVDDTTADRAAALAERHGGLDPDRPLPHTARTIAAGAMDLACRLEGDEPRQSEVADAAGRSVDAIRRCVGAMQPRRGNAAEIIDRRWQAIADGGDGDG